MFFMVQVEGAQLVLLAPGFSLISGADALPPKGQL